MSTPENNGLTLRKGVVNQSVIIVVIAIVLLWFWYNGLDKQDEAFFKVQFYDKDGKPISAVNNKLPPGVIANNVENVEYAAFTTTVKNTGEIPLTLTLKSASPKELEDAYISAQPVKLTQGLSHSWTSSLIRLSDFLDDTQPVRFSVTVGGVYTYGNETKSVGDKQGIYDINIKEDPKAGFDISFSGGMGSTPGTGVSPAPAPVEPVPSQPTPPPTQPTPPPATPVCLSPRSETSSYAQSCNVIPCCSPARDPVGNACYNWQCWETIYSFGTVYWCGRGAVSYQCAGSSGVGGVSTPAPESTCYMAYEEAVSSSTPCCNRGNWFGNCYTLARVTGWIAPLGKVTTACVPSIKQINDYQCQVRESTTETASQCVPSGGRCISDSSCCQPGRQSNGDFCKMQICTRNSPNDATGTCQSTGGVMGNGIC